MLIRFICENFLSFGNEKNGFEFLNTAASKTKSLPNHVVKISPNIAVLRGVAVYGANASGKTNFIKAINFAKNIIESYKEGIEEHNLGANQNKFCKSDKSKFVFEFKLEDSIYEYGFEITSKEIVSEWLKSTNLNGKLEKIFFEREGNKITNDKNVATIIKIEKKDDNFFKYLKKAVKPNQLLLHRLLEDNVGFAKVLLRWFAKIVFVREFDHSSYFFSGELFDFAKKILMKIDNRVSGLRQKKEELTRASDIVGMPFLYAEKFFSTLENHSKSNEKGIVIAESGNGDHLYFSVGDKGVKYQHELLIKRNGQEFSLKQESDGIRKIFDLIPMLFTVQNKQPKQDNPKSIFVIDEIQQSLHPHIAEEIIKMFFEFGKSSESQIIFTTHDINLLNLSLLRKDEIWFAEKDTNLNTHLTSLAEFKDVREDLVISKGYLQGRFGAIPFIGNWRG